MSRAGRRRGALLAAVGAAALALIAGAASCTRARTDPSTVQRPTRAPAVAVLGGNETLASDLDDPLRDGWTQVALADDLPEGSTLVNLSTKDATVTVAARALAVADDLAPTDVVVWMGAGDVKAATPDAVFASSLRALLATIDGQHARAILVAGSTPLDATVRQVGRDASVAVVDVADLGETFGPAEHREIARRVAAAVSGSVPS